jgi:hypothetical protein
MATFTKINSFVEAMAEKVHNLGSDQLMIALTASANAPLASNTVLANLTEISYTNLSSRVLTVASSAQTSGTYKLVINDLTLTATGAVATFRYVMLYNNTATNKELIGFYDTGGDVTMANGETYIVDFDGTNGVINIA